MLKNKDIEAIATRVVQKLKEEGAMLEDYIRYPQAMELLGVSSAFLQKRKDIPRKKIGKIVFFRKGDLVRFIENEGVI